MYVYQCMYVQIACLPFFIHLNASTMQNACEEPNAQCSILGGHIVHIKVSLFPSLSPLSQKLVYAKALSEQRFPPGKSESSDSTKSQQYTVLPPPSISRMLWLPPSQDFLSASRHLPKPLRHPHPFPYYCHTQILSHPNC